MSLDVYTFILRKFIQKKILLEPYYFTTLIDFLFYVITYSFLYYQFDQLSFSEL
jgi:hypothetical protein